MSIKKISKEQPEKFEFNSENINLANKIISNYPKGKQKSAVMAFLFIAQRQNDGWISDLPLSALKAIKANKIRDKLSSHSKSFLLV